MISHIYIVSIAIQHILIMDRESLRYHGRASYPPSIDLQYNRFNAGITQIRIYYHD